MRRRAAAVSRTLAALAAALAAGAVAACTAGPIDVARLPDDSLQTGLVAHFSFDDGAGDVVRDESGNLRNGTLLGATWAAGKFGGALHFVPGNQVTVPAFPDATPSWTVSAWLFIASSELGPEYETLLSAENPFVGGWEVNAIFVPGVPRYHFGYYVGPTQSDYDYAECNCFAADRWVHLAAAVDDATRTLALYIDGQLAQRVPIRGLISPGVSTLSMGTWLNPALDAPRPLAGALDDVAIWSRALVPEEVARLAAAPAPRAP